MAAVFAGMTILQLAELIAALNGGALSLLKIHEELKKGGAKDGDSLPMEVMNKVKAVAHAALAKAEPGLPDPYAGE